MAGVGDRQTKKLQGSVESQEAVIGVLLLAPIQRPLDLAPDVGQLFNKGQTPPSSGR